MTPLERVDVGFIGCGRIATLQVLGYLDHPRARLVAVCDQDESIARRRQQEWGARKMYTDYQRLLIDPDINAVEILLPHHLHRDVAIAALQAGKHVSLQKPPTLTLGDLGAVAEAAKRAGRCLRVLENSFVVRDQRRAPRRRADLAAVGSPAVDERGDRRRPLR
jgi:predicted dehydrogenase